MTHIIIPTRIIPAVLLGCAFAAVGMFGGLAIFFPIFHFDHFRPATLLFAVPFPFAIYYVWHTWSRERSSGRTARVTSVSPRLLAVLLAVCLLTGFVTAAFISSMPVN